MPSAEFDAGCGGCRGVGSHRRHCPRHPDYHPWKRLADMAESIGDSIGGNDPGLANRAYALSGAIKEAIPAHPWTRVTPPGGFDESADALFIDTARAATRPIPPGEGNL